MTSPTTVLVIYCTNDRENNLRCVKEQVTMFHRAVNQIYVAIPIPATKEASLVEEKEPYPFAILYYHPSSDKTVEGFLTSILRMECNPETSIVLIHWDRNYTSGLIRQLRRARSEYPGCAIGFGGYDYDEERDYFVYTTDSEYPCWLDTKKGILLQRSMFESDYEGIIYAKRYMDAPYFEGRHEWAWSSYLHYKHVDMRVVPSENRQIVRPTRKKRADPDKVLCRDIDYSSTLKDSKSGLILQRPEEKDRWRCCKDFCFVLVSVSAVFISVAIAQDYLNA